jgi:hypothetical protein
MLERRIKRRKLLEKNFEKIQKLRQAKAQK